MQIPRSMSKFLLPVLMYAAMSEGSAPTPERIEAKEPVKSHGGAGRNIHKKKTKRKSKWQK